MADVKKDVLRETDGEAIRLARTLLRSARHGALATLDPSSGAPVATRVATATDHDGTPLILVSSLSAHTAAILADPRCSLLLGEAGKGDPLAHPRISIACRARKLERGATETARAERRYLNRNPKAKLYAGFPDFAFFALDVDGASLNGGFGKAYALSRSDLLLESPVSRELEGAEQSAIDHMNSDHRDAIALYARHFAKAGEGDFSIAGIDAEGLDLTAGDKVCRVFFPQPLAAIAALRPMLVAMAREARQAEAA